MVKIRWAGNVARMGEMRRGCRVLVGKRDVKNHLEDTGIDGSGVARNRTERRRLDRSGSGQGQVAGIL